ncbi:MAG TPA: SRPBCC family protein [Intrasporangium sp.]|uniref:SRPBCC family protein n=1 Tax=Intrasporangium sp. TaxID=1925024 RepID=UPI002D787862|nr:SRPBCC family protein [Intrasporangium sp.]HET7398179.1 SRPBCC family protein [Intrasporangium sp.]
MAVATATAALRRWYLRWGATDEEVAARLAGDDLLPKADLLATRAITVHASPDRVWPWLAQMGQGRGGLYSYDWLENLVGCDLHSADRIVPEWQDVAVGDPFRLHPQATLTVAHVDPGRALVVRAPRPLDDRAATGRFGPIDFTWAFVLRDESGGRWDGGTRLLVRERYAYLAPWAALVAEPVEALSALMSQRMLRGIRDRAERQAVA